MNMRFFLKHLFCLCSAALWLVCLALLMYLPWYIGDGKVNMVSMWIGVTLFGVLYLMANALVVLLYALFSKTLCYEKHADALISVLVNGAALPLICVVIKMMTH